MRLRELAEAVRTGDTSAEALVHESAARISRDNTLINAVTQLRIEQAVTEACALDAEIADGKRSGVLAGLPLLVKDIDDVSGMPTFAGSRTRQDSPLAGKDGRTVARLRAEGAIVIGKTNLPEFAAEGYTSNLLHGTTRNPWAPQWSPGGSSGGSAAALSAGMAPLATASDGGGSIRIPAAFCGLVGLKPSRGTIGRRPIPEWLDLTSDGPMGTSVDDVRLLFELLAGGECGDPDSMPVSWPAGPDRPRHALVLERTTDFGPLPTEVAELFASAVEHFCRLFGVAPRYLEPGAVFAGSPDEDWSVMAATEHAHHLGAEWLTRHAGQLHDSTREFLEYGLTTSLDQYLSARRRRFDYTDIVDRLLGAHGVMLSPSVAVPGIPADGSLSATGVPGAWPASTYVSALQNITGHPAISLPAGRCANGVPFGLQVSAPRLADLWLLDLAATWEREHPWPLTAPGFAPFAIP